MKRTKKNIKRKVKRVRTVVHSITPDLLPPHLLDQIPPGSTLRPTVKSLRQIALQRLANQVPMIAPLAPQAQQLQTMKSNNDLKESAINQAKQDMMNETERKRSLQKEESDMKRANQQMKQKIEDEKQEMTQKMKYENERSKLENELKDLNFNKQGLINDNYLQNIKAQADYQKALVEQYKFENQKLQFVIDNNNIVNKFDTYSKELKDLKVQNHALKKTIKKINSEGYMNDYQDLVTNIAEAKAQQIVLITLKDVQNKTIEDKLLSMTYPSTQQIEDQITELKGDIEGKQKAYVEQLKLKEQRNDDLERLKNQRRYKVDLLNKTDDLVNENIALTKMAETKPGSLDTEITSMVEAESNRDLAREKLTAKQSENDARRQQIVSDERQKIMNSDEYKRQIREISREAAIANEWKNSIKLTQEAQDNAEQALRNNIKYHFEQVALNAKINDKNVIDALQESIPNTQDRTAAMFFEQLASQLQLKSQEMNDAGVDAVKLSQLYSSPAAEGHEFRAFVQQKFGSEAELKDALSDLNPVAINDIKLSFLNGPTKDDK